MDSDLTLTKFDFQYHFEFGGKTHYVFGLIGRQNPVFALFDEKGNYETFGLDNLSVMGVYGTIDDSYLSLDAKINNKNHIVLLNNKLNIVALYDTSELQDDVLFIGYSGNTFYYMANPFEGKILEIHLSEIIDEPKVTFDANGGLFKDKDKYTIENWTYEDYNNLINPTRDGYTFKGYYTEKTGGTKLEMILNESGIDRDMTFYARWEENSVGGAGTAEPEEENPNTYDGIESTILVSLLSFIGLVSISLYIKKDKGRAN